VVAVIDAAILRPYDFSPLSYSSQRISREEFHKGCALLNGMMSEDSEQRLTNIDHTLDLMDFDGSDDLDINEFFEVRTFVFPSVCRCVCLLPDLDIALGDTALIRACFDGV
jgi:hypothetical protein